MFLYIAFLLGLVLLVVAFAAGYRLKAKRARRREKRLVQAALSSFDNVGLPRGESQNQEIDPRQRAWDAQVTLALLTTDSSLCRHIDVGGTSAERLALIEHTRKVWYNYGKKDPFFSVLTDDKFKLEAMTAEAEQEFYDSGAWDAETLFKACERNGLIPGVGGTIVDFGCGLGRIGEHLAKKFERYVGVDISRSHLNRAEARMSINGLRNVRFMLLSEYLDNLVPADVIFSFIVLQHNPPPIIAMLLDRLCSTLRPGGVAYFQVPTALFDYEFRLSDYLKAPPSHGGMEMHALPQHEVFKILERNRCFPSEVVPDGKAGSLGISTTFLARKAAS